VILTSGLTLSVFAMLSVLPQLKERALADVAVIGIPRGIEHRASSRRPLQRGVLWAARWKFQCESSFRSDEQAQLSSGEIYG
jgi:hypothetical protein